MASVILLTKRDRFSRLAQGIARAAFDDLIICDGAVGDPEPGVLSDGGADVLISFLSPWIVRAATLERCETSINFHPGSTDYPGIGCYNFALYEEAREFGAVCHHMLPKVDTGRIVLERRFPVSQLDSVETLKLATMETMIGMYREIVDVIAAGKPLPLSSSHWSRRPFTRRELEALKLCHDGMTETEVRRRVRATVYPGYPGPVLHRADGTRHIFEVPDRPPLA